MDFLVYHIDLPSMSKQEDKIKSLKINAKTTNSSKELATFQPLVEMIARKEIQTKSKQFITYDELVNTGFIAVNKLIESAKHTNDTEFNSSYIAQSVKWAMKDEVRARQSWYGVKKVVPVAGTKEDKIAKEAEAEKKADAKGTTQIKSLDDARSVVYEVIMSVEGMEEDVGFTPADLSSPEHLERLELLEMKSSLKKAVSKLPDNLRKVIEMRFYKNMSGNEVAEKLAVTPSRISHMIKDATKKLKVLMTAEGYDAV